MSRFWLVELHDDDELKRRKTTPRGTWAQIFILEGVKALTDMDAISADTLTDILLPMDQAWTKPKRTSSTSAASARRSRST